MTKKYKFKYTRTKLSKGFHCSHCRGTEFTYKEVIEDDKGHIVGTCANVDICGLEYWLRQGPLRKIQPPMELKLKDISGMSGNGL